MEVMTFSVASTDLVKEGDDVTMKCETDGNPQPGFDFKKGVSDCVIQYTGPFMQSGIKLQGIIG